jgi:hypothetical protein
MPEGIYSGANPAEVMSDLRNLVNFQDKGMGVIELTRELEEKLIPHLLQQAGISVYVQYVSRRRCIRGSRNRSAI